jgi:hypothetical protein
VPSRRRDRRHPFKIPHFSESGNNPIPPSAISGGRPSATWSAPTSRSGWRCRSAGTRPGRSFESYNIVSDGDLREAAKKLGTIRQNDTDTRRDHETAWQGGDGRPQILENLAGSLQTGLGQARLTPCESWLFPLKPEELPSTWSSWVNVARLQTVRIVGPGRPCPGPSRGGREPSALVQRCAELVERPPPASGASVGVAGRSVWLNSSAFVCSPSPSPKRRGK